MCFTVKAQPGEFVSVNRHTFLLHGKPYYFVGANYWYGGLLGLEKDKRRGVQRLRRELDFLKSNGITNLRLMAGAEGSGLINGVTRVGPPLQPKPGQFDKRVLDGLDLVLDEMRKRDMKAVIFLSNNWEWSGGFHQYLIWNGLISNKWLTRKPTWDELRDNVAKFYSCPPCIAGYNKQVSFVLGRKNRYNGRKYTDDATIFAWELANEPRPMRPAAARDYSKWISDSAALIKSLDSHHLVTTGHEGWIGTEGNALFKEVHENRNIDYLTIHIWPKNWGWFRSGQMDGDFARLTEKTHTYLAMHIADAAMLDKPLVIEEFGLPRDAQSFDPASPTTYRDTYFKYILSYIKASPHVAGANFWAFGGTARPHKNQLFWKSGDDLMGDPPMEEQGLNSVFDGDLSTWKVVAEVSRGLNTRPYSERASTLCRRLNEIKRVPYDPSLPGGDPIYDGLMRQGREAIPCLVGKITDKTQMDDPNEAPKIPGFRVGDAAVFMLLYITKEDWHPESMFPPKYVRLWKTEGVYAYAKYVEKAENRRKIQLWWKNWMKRNLKSKDPWGGRM